MVATHPLSKAARASATESTTFGVQSNVRKDSSAGLVRRASILHLPFDVMLQQVHATSGLPEGRVHLPRSICETFEDVPVVIGVGINCRTEDVILEMREGGCDASRLESSALLVGSHQGPSVGKSVVTDPAERTSRYRCPVRLPAENSLDGIDVDADGIFEPGSTPDIVEYRRSGQLAIGAAGLLNRCRYRLRDDGPSITIG